MRRLGQEDLWNGNIAVALLSWQYLQWRDKNAKVGMSTLVIQNLWEACKERSWWQMEATC
jgi:hypothetical protein